MLAPTHFDAKKLVPIAGTFLEKAISTKQAHLSFDEKGRRVITYLAAPGSRKEIYDDPEEQVRAEFWAELLHRYHYPAHRVALEFPVPDRAPKDFADIVVFSDDDRKSPFIVVEVKKQKISAAEFTQAIEQAFGNGHAHKFHAKYIAVVSGATRRAFDLSEKYPIGEREQNLIADVPISYGKIPEYKYICGGALDIAPVSKDTLIATIEKCHQTLWGGGKLSPPAAFGELCKLIFAKTSEERNRRKNQPYEFQIRTYETPTQLGKRIRALYDKYRKVERDATGVFDETIKLPDPMISSVVSHLQGIDLQDTDLDTKGVAFERFMDGFFKGNFGQYFTPREVIQFAVELFPPGVNDRVLDPACGSGGFLLHCLDYIRREANQEFPDYQTDTKEAKRHFQYWHDFAERQLFGIEINDEIARVAKMNMILHDDGHTNVIGEDALERFAQYDMVLTGAFRPDSFDLIPTNPPFGASVSFTDKPYALELFPELGFVHAEKGGKKARKNQKTEVLYLERIHQFLREGGRASVVLPDGILTNSSLAYARDFLVERFQIKAVISLPQMAFAHYGAGVKSSLVFLEKRFANEIPDDDEAIFMAAPENIGYDATGRKTWKLLERNPTEKGWKDTLRCDLFDAQVEFEILNGEVFERATQIIPGSGLLGEYQKFTQNPEPFFV